MRIAKIVFELERKFKRDLLVIITVIAAVIITVF